MNFLKRLFKQFSFLFLRNESKIVTSKVLEPPKNIPEEILNPKILYIALVEIETRDWTYTYQIQIPDDSAESIYTLLDYTRSQYKDHEIINLNIKEIKHHKRI